MASRLATLRKDLSAPELIRIVREQFSKINDSRHQGIIRYTLPDTLCAALALFQFKWPSLWQFDEHCHDDLTHFGNLRRPYSLDKVASDSSGARHPRSDQAERAGQGIPRDPFQRTTWHGALRLRGLRQSVSAVHRRYRPALLDQGAMPALWRQEAPQRTDRVLPPARWQR